MLLSSAINFNLMCRTETNRTAKKINCGIDSLPILQALASGGTSHKTMSEYFIVVYNRVHYIGDQHHDN